MKLRTIFTFLLISLFAVSIVAQTQQGLVQKGITYRYNGKNPKIVMGQVYIKAATSQNGVLSNEADGCFSLLLQNVQMGSRIGSVTVTKKGMMVFNQQAVDEWSVRKEPLRLILCDTDEFEKQKQNLIAIGKAQAKKNYDKRLADIEAKYKASQLKIDEYYQQLDSLDKANKSLLEQLDKSSEEIARIDLSEMDENMQQVVELYEKGRVEEAMDKLHSMNLLNEFDQRAEKELQVEREIASLQQKAANYAEDQLAIVAKMKAAVPLLKSNNQWDEAGAYLKRIADKLNTADDIWNYAVFSYAQNNYAEAEKYYKKALEKYRGLAVSNPQTYEPNVAIVLNNLANLYYQTNDYDSSEILYTEALEIQRRLAETAPQIYKKEVASTLNNYANLMVKKGELVDAEAFFHEGLSIYRKEAESDSLNAVMANLAATYNNLGSLYASDNIYDPFVSKIMYEEARIIYSRLSKSSPDEYESDYAMVLNNLASLLSKNKGYDESGRLLKEALEIYRRLVVTNPKVYEPNVANILLNLGLIKKNKEAQETLKEAMAIYERLAIVAPKRYESYYYRTWNNLLDTYDGKREKINVLANIVKVYRGFVEYSPDYEPQLAKSLLLQGECYVGINQDEDDKSEEGDTTAVYNDREAQKLLKEAMGIFERLMMSKPYDYEPSFKKAWESLAKSYMDREEKLSLLENVAIVYRGFAEKGTDFELKLAEALYVIGHYSFLIKKYTQSVIYDYEGVAIYRRLASIDHKYNSNLSSLLGNLSFTLMFTRKFSDAERSAREAISLNKDKLWIYTNLAASLLFQGKYEEAEEIYMRYKDDLWDGKKLSKSMLEDLNMYAEEGIISKEHEEEVQKVGHMLYGIIDEFEY